MKNLKVRAGTQLDKGSDCNPDVSEFDSHPALNKLQELMIITMEECGELIQACSKAIRCNSYYDNKKLLEEIGDVQCMIELILDEELVNWEDVNDQMHKKRKKLKKWSNLLSD